MLTRWTQHLTTEEDKEKYRNKILGARDILEHLHQMLSEDEEMLTRSENDQKVYDLPNWDYRQAHRNGIRQYIHTLKKLINLDQKETKYS